MICVEDYEVVLVADLSIEKILSLKESISASFSLIRDCSLISLIYS